MHYTSHLQLKWLAGIAGQTRQSIAITNISSTTQVLESSAPAVSCAEQACLRATTFQDLPVCGVVYCSFYIPCLREGNGGKA
jgi:hypothetical protein